MLYYNICLILYICITIFMYYIFLYSNIIIYTYVCMIVFLYFYIYICMYGI